MNLRAKVNLWTPMEGLPEASTRGQAKGIQAPSRAMTPWILLLPLVCEACMSTAKTAAYSSYMASKRQGRLSFCLCAFSVHQLEGRILRQAQGLGVDN